MKNKISGANKDIQCVVTDWKAHSYCRYPDGHNNQILPNGTKGEVNVPTGLIQTGIAYPNSTNAKLSLACSIDYMNGTIVEFCGWKVTDFNCSDFELDKIISNEKKHV